MVSIPFKLIQPHDNDQNYFLYDNDQDYFLYDNDQDYFLFDDWDYKTLW